MSKLKLSGASSSNSVTFFLSNSTRGIEATRQNDGSITTKVATWNGATGQLNTIIIVLGLLREVCFLLNLPIWIFHIPTIFSCILLLSSVLLMLKSKEKRMYHGAEHMIRNWYKSNPKNNVDIKSINKFSRIDLNCGSNIIATIFVFQLISSICMNYFSIHIPEIITSVLPFFVYCILPFNIFGLLVQLLTTAKPKEEHLEVASKALLETLKNTQ